MKWLWSSILYLAVIHISNGTLLKHLQFPKPGGLIEKILKPKEPTGSFQTGFHVGGGNFGFGFGFGYGKQGNYVPPTQKPRPSCDEDEEEKKIDHQPDKEDVDKVGAWEDETNPHLPDWEGDTNKEGPKFEETSKEKYPDWEDIGEEDEKKSEEFMDGELVESGLIQPRLNTRRRSKRFIESRVYYVPLTFRSNAKPYKLKIDNKPHSLRKKKLRI